MGTVTKQHKNAPELSFSNDSSSWTQTKLKNLAERIGDGIHTTPVYEEEGEFYFVNGNNLDNGRIRITESTKKVSATEAKKHHRELDLNTLLLSINGTVGNVAKYNGEKITLGKSACYIKLNKETILGFLYHLIQSSTVQRFYYSEVTGSTIKNLSLKSVGNTPVFLPDTAEQQKIADFLGSVDAWLDNLRSQKTVLETYKRGMMQKLFTQQVRFKDDSGNNFPEWEEKELGSVFKAVKGTGLSKESLDKDGTNECILYGELYTTYSEVITEIKSKTNITEGALSKKGDLLIPSSTTTTAIDLANVTALNKEGVLLGGDITVLRGVDEVSNVFYAYYLSNHKKIELAKYGQGVTIIHIYYSHIKDMLIDVPTLPEQQKIADFLTAIDHTITAKAAEITQVEQWKKGLMQKMFI